MLAFAAPFLMKLFPRLVLEKAQKLSKFVLIVLMIIIAVVSFFVWLNGVKDEAVQDERQRVEALGSKAREVAADERVNDAATNAATEKGLNDAIVNAPKGGTVSPAAHALNCQRLRNIGRVPPGC